VSGFSDCFYQILQSELRRVFYSSSVYVDEEPSNLLEYVVCKKAGETLCSFLQNIHPDVLFYCPRLPRMSTDQTANLGPSKDQSSAPVMITHLRRLRHERHRADEFISPA